MAKLRSVQGRLRCKFQTMCFKDYNVEQAVCGEKAYHGRITVTQVACNAVDLTAVVNFQH